jgi:hypothetical protein
MILIEKIKNIFKKEEDNIDDKIIWWSTVDGLEKVEPVVRAKEALPDWWKKIVKISTQDKMNNLSNKGNIANCPSFPEFMSNGFVVKLWCDLELEVEPNGKYKWKTPINAFNFSSHASEQFKDWLPKNVQDNVSIVLKPDCPWRVKTPPGYSMLQLPMFYHYNPLFEVAAGTIWTDVHHEINQQMIIKRYGKIFIPRGTPLAHYIPYKREKFDFEVQKPTEENASWHNRGFLEVRTKWFGGYKMNQAKQREKLAKCPYHNKK